MPHRCMRSSTTPLQLPQMHLFHASKTLACTCGGPRFMLQMSRPMSSRAAAHRVSTCTAEGPDDRSLATNQLPPPTSFPAIVNAFATQPYYWQQGAEVVTSCTLVLPEGVRGHQPPPYPKPYPRLEGRPVLIARRARRRRRRRSESARNWQRIAAYGGTANGGTPGRRHRRPGVHL